MIRFHIPFTRIYGHVHKDIIEIIGGKTHEKQWRIGIMWFAWFYVSRTWNVTWNVDKKFWFSIYNMEDYR